MKTENRNEQMKQATKSLAIWTILWVLSLALSIFGSKLIWQENIVLSILVISINTVIGIKMIYANVKHLSAQDELQKKIQLDAMGIALGAGVVGGLSYSSLDVTNVISSDAEISFLVMLISISYLVALLIGKQRYA